MMILDSSLLFWATLYIKGECGANGACAGNVQGLEVIVKSAMAVAFGVDGN